MATYLVLHGYHQNADIILKKVKDLLPKNSTLVVPNGPLTVEDGLNAWFPLSRIDLKNGIVTINRNDIAVILTQEYTTTKFDGIIAFSQGCLAAITLLGAGKIFAPKLLLFSPIPIVKDFPYTLPDNIKSRVYIGMKDDLVHPSHSRDFAAFLGSETKCIDHMWGHVIPSTAQYKSEYSDFLTL